MIRIIESSLQKYPQLAAFFALQEPQESAFKALSPDKHYLIDYQDAAKGTFQQFTSLPLLCVRLKKPQHLRLALQYHVPFFVYEEMLDIAAELGDVDVLKRLLQNPERIHDDATLNAYKICAKQGNHEALVTMLQQSIAGKHPDAQSNAALCEAARYGHLSIVKHLLNYPSVLSNILAQDAYALRWAHRNQHYDIASLLLQYPAVFSYAENQYFENNRNFLQKYIQEWQSTLRNKFQNRAVFTSQETQQCLYLLRYLIRKNQTNALESIYDLLQIPRIRQVVHNPVIGKADFELLNLAKSVNNQAAVEWLSAIEKTEKKKIISRRKMDNIAFRHPELGWTIGNPPLLVLTSQLLQRECSEFIRNFYKQKISRLNQVDIKEALQNYFANPERPIASTLSDLNISREEQEKFIHTLKEKYKNQFTACFLQQVKDKFLLPENTAHLSQFYDSDNLKNVLKKETDIPLGFFNKKLSEAVPRTNIECYKR